MASDALFSAALLLVLVPLGAGALLLVRWLREPIVEAQRLALEPEPAQEQTFEDPNATSASARLYVARMP